MNNEMMQISTFCLRNGQGLSDLKGNKLIILSAALALAAMLLQACQQGKTEKEIAPLVQPELLSTAGYGEQLQLNQRRDALYGYITQKLSDDNGVFTNYTDTKQSAEVATGHELLSESFGLRMRYYALTGQSGAFDQEWERAKRTFDMASGFSYRYSPLHNKRYPLNAAVDDLRLIRALHEGAEAFGNKEYAEEAKRYSERFLAYNVKDGKLFDFYDESLDQTNTFITLCYIDLKTLGLVADTNIKQHDLNGELLRVIEGGYLTDDFPFYETRYDYQRSEYSSESIRTVESLLTILALAEMGQQKEASIRYIKEHVAAGTLYGSYTTQGKPDTDIRSTAIYAITAMIGSELEDRSLFESSINRMNELQVWSQDSPYYGGFADPHSGQAYSFDNLMALLAYSY